MGLESIFRVREWKGLVRDLKQGRDFGIHGITYEKLQEILRMDKSRGVMGHYFAVDKKAKQVSDGEFYNRLWCSVDVAVGYSMSFTICGNRAEFKKRPHLLLGIDCGERKSIYSDSPAFHGLYGETLDVGHDFYTFGGVKLYPVRLQSRDIVKINESIERFARGKILMGNMSQAFLAQQELVKIMLRKVHRELKKE